jgi:glycosyltransferase involved in cell wall biosynthesis
VTISVLHVAQPVDAGVPGVAAALIADQVARGWDVSAASPPGWDLHAAAPELGARWLSWPAVRNPGFSTFGETRRLAQIVDEVDPTLIHVHSAKAGLAGRLVVRGRRATVFQPHAWSFEAASGATGRAAASWERAAARWTDVIVCVSDGERRRGEEVGVRARYDVIPNGVDLRRWEPASADDRVVARQGLGVDTGVPLAVAVGRLAPQKGQDVLLAAWTRVSQSVPEAELVLVGDGPLRSALEAHRMERVRFAGDVDDVAPWLAAANVTVIPSRWEAGLSLVAMEAMARARSVVATDVAGMADGIAGGCGAVVPVADADALAAALAERLTDPSLADVEGSGGRHRVEERYEVGATSARIAKLYERVLAERLSGVALSSRRLRPGR